MLSALSSAEFPLVENFETPGYFGTRSIDSHQFRYGSQGPQAYDSFVLEKDSEIIEVSLSGETLPENIVPGFRVRIYKNISIYQGPGTEPVDAPAFTELAKISGELAVLDSQLGVNGDITKYGLRVRSKVLLGAGKYWISVVLSSAINRDTRFSVFSTEWSWAVANNDDSAFFRVFVGRPAGGVIGNTNMAYTVYGLYHTPSSFDSDGVGDTNDSCIMTPIGEEVDSSGYSISERDIDGDGIFNEWDECPDTLKDENKVIDSVGCEHL